MTAVIPETFVDEYGNFSYAELLPVRDELFEQIRKYEEKTGNGKGTYPGNSLYMVNLGYLSALIDLIEEKYREMQWA